MKVGKTVWSMADELADLKVVDLVDEWVVEKDAYLVVLKVALMAYVLVVLMAGSLVAYLVCRTVVLWAVYRVASKVIV